MQYEFGFYELVWSSCIAILLFFSIVCYSLYHFVKQKSFKYYSFYCLFLMIYLSIKQQYILDHLWGKWFNLDYPEAILVNFNWYIQVVFYTFYSLFGLYFTDVDLVFPSFSKRIKKYLYGQLIFATLLFVVTSLMGNRQIFVYFFLFWFVPFLLIQFVVAIPKIAKTKGHLKRGFVLGLSIYIAGALVALYFSLNYDRFQIESPLIFFLIGVLIECIFFGLGIAFKYKDIYEDRAQKNKELATLAFNQEINVLRGMMEGEQRERKRVSTELHDNLGNLLATALLQFDSVARSNQYVEEHENYRKGMKLLDTAADEVRTIAHNMIPKTIYEHGINHAIEEIAENITSLDVKFSSELHDYSISEKQSVLIYRIVQEIFNNIIKHANAKNVQIRLITVNDFLHLTIEDDGIGFSEDTVEKGLGLRNLYSRAKLLGGKVQFNSKPGKGTKVLLVVPMETNLAEADNQYF